VLVLVQLGAVAYIMSDFVPGISWSLAPLVALYSVATLLPRTTSLVAAGALLVVNVWLVVEGMRYGQRGEVGWDSVVSTVALVAGTWLLGSWVRTQRAYMRALQALTVGLARQREEHARRAAAAERARIARELHDVVAHHVSVIAVHAGAAGDVLAVEPERARTSLGTIGRASRQALAELRRLLEVLKDPDREHDTGAFAPPPSLRQLDQLVESTRAAGLPVSVELRGLPDRLPEAVDASAYRILQEALTNVLRHAGPASATVQVRHEHGTLLLHVTDDGVGGGHLQPGADARSGWGLIGMRERAALFGGEVRAGPRQGGGFEVVARLPLGEPVVTLGDQAAGGDGDGRGLDAHPGADRR
jgi:signal transduction histidine kinase